MCEEIFKISSFACVKVSVWAYVRARAFICTHVRACDTLCFFLNWHFLFISSLILCFNLTYTLSWHLFSFEVNGCECIMIFHFSNFTHDTILFVFISSTHMSLNNWFNKFVIEWLQRICKFSSPLSKIIHPLFVNFFLYEWFSMSIA